MKENKARVQEAEKKVIETALRHHIHPRCEYARFYLDLGVKDFSLGLEMRVLQTFLSKEGDELLNLMAAHGIIRR